MAPCPNTKNSVGGVVTFRSILRSTLLYILLWGCCCCCCCCSAGTLSTASFVPPSSWLAGRSPAAAETSGGHHRGGSRRDGGTPTNQKGWTMDVEGPVSGVVRTKSRNLRIQRHVPVVTRYPPQPRPTSAAVVTAPTTPTFTQRTIPHRRRRRRRVVVVVVHESVTQAERSHGMPWQTSIADTVAEDQDGNSSATQNNENPNHLFYMPFWEWQMQFMKEHLTRLRGVPVIAKHSGTDLSYVESLDGTMRMHTCCFASHEYQRIRMTVLDAGHQTQVFSSVWYPANHSLQPILAVELLQFNRAKKHLCVVDFQPVCHHQANREAFEQLLEPIRSQYPSLQGILTDRFYNDHDTYFSNQMLLGRHTSNNNNKNDDDDDEGRSSARSMVYDDLFPAYQQYLATHVRLVQQDGTTAASSSTTSAHNHGENRPRTAEHVDQCHAAYDTYHANSRDPSHALLSRAFGATWADDFRRDILFPSATTTPRQKLPP